MSELALTRIDEAVCLLRVGRRFANESVIDHNTFAAYRRELDAFLAQFIGDDPRDSYDTAERVEHRNLVEYMSKGLPYA